MYIPKLFLPRQAKLLRSAGQSFPSVAVMPAAKGSQKGMSEYRREQRQVPKRQTKRLETQKMMGAENINRRRHIMAVRGINKVILVGCR
nr:hypothetical protein [Escherichia coli]UPG28449.1 hypothetical protein J4V62_000245 [Escherichia coli]